MKTHELLTPGEVARLFHVEVRTVARWHKSGLITGIRTPGGHRRFRRNAVERLLSVRSRPE